MKVQSLHFHIRLLLQSYRLWCHCLPRLWSHRLLRFLRQRRSFHCHHLLLPLRRQRRSRHWRHRLPRLTRRPHRLHHFYQHSVCLRLFRQQQRLL